MREASGESEMYRIAIADVAEGARLGVRVFNETVRLLVKAGVTLTAFQLDQVEPDEEIQPEFLPPEIRAEVIQSLRPVVDFLVDAWRRDAALIDLERHRMCRNHGSASGKCRCRQVHKIRS